MSIYFACKTTSMIVISFFERSFCRIYVYFFIITTIVGFVAIHLHLIHYAFILAFTLQGTSVLVNAVAFRGLNMLFILEFFSVIFIDQI